MYLKYMLLKYWNTCSNWFYFFLSVQPGGFNQQPAQIPVSYCPEPRNKPVRHNMLISRLRGAGRTFSFPPQTSCFLLLPVFVPERSSCCSLNCISNTELHLCSHLQPTVRKRRKSMNCCFKIKGRVPPKWSVSYDLRADIKSGEVL